MDALNPPNLPAETTPAPRLPRVWKFWGTSLWGLFVFAAAFAGQAAVLGYYALVRGISIDTSSLGNVAGGGLLLPLSVIAGLPAVVLALWFAIRWSRTPFADYLALRWTSWRYLAIGVVAMFALAIGWAWLGRAMGREIVPGFMGDLLKSARGDGVLWLLLVAICVAAPMWEEFFTRGFLYRGWSESFLRPVGAIILSSLCWTALHLQYDLFFLTEVFSIGLLFGYLRYASGSTWLTVVLHGLNNFAATMQAIVSSGQQ